MNDHKDPDQPKKYYEYTFEKYGITVRNENGLFEWDIALMELLFEESIKRGNPPSLNFTPDELVSMMMKKGWDMTTDGPPKRLN